MWLFAFMTSFLTFRGTARTDERHRASTLSMTHYDEPISGGIGDRKEPVFTRGMTGIIKRRRARIKKDGYRLIEGNAVFFLNSTPPFPYPIRTACVPLKASNVGICGGRRHHRAQPYMAAACAGQPQQHVVRAQPLACLATFVFFRRGSRR